MSVISEAQAKKLVSKFLKEKPQYLQGNLANVLKDNLPKRKAILALTKKYPTPFYAFDDKAANNAAQEFKTIFTKAIPNLEIYYAVKSNPCSYLLETVVKNGLGLDVSSGRELNFALKAKAKKIVFSGPGKTDPELKLAIANADKLIIHLDSFSELKRLGKMLRASKKTIRAGVRVYTKYHDAWTKFGISLTELPEFFELAKKYPNIDLGGIQCHMSWNQGAEPYQKMLAEIAKAIKKLSLEQRQQIKFIDFGGGYEAHRYEGQFSWATAQGEVLKTAAEYFGKSINFKDKYYLNQAPKLEVYAQGIAQAIKKYLDPLISCQYFCEPGRIISYQSMHLILGVVDVKKPGMAILDGGNNMLGYELFEEYYYPTINLTRPANKEIACHLFGSLCTPYDLFGYYCYAKSIKEGDIIMIPNQGAYTFTLAQDFIKGIPPVYRMRK
jgi:diaminopimelate decarboxylase